MPQSSSLSGPLGSDPPDSGARLVPVSRPRVNIGLYRQEAQLGILRLSRNCRGCPTESRPVFCFPNSRIAESTAGCLRSQGRPARKFLTTSCPSTSCPSNSIYIFIFNRSAHIGTPSSARLIATFFHANESTAWRIGNRAMIPFQHSVRTFHHSRRPFKSKKL